MRKQALTILALLVAIAAPTGGKAGDASRVNSGAAAAPARKVAPEQGGSVLRKSTPAQKAAPVQETPPTQKATPDRPAGTLQPRPRLGTTRAVENSRALSSVADCASGFARAIKPDHPAGFYECRLPASPACRAGYDYQDDFANPRPARFQYTCEKWLDENDGSKCPQSWTRKGSGFSYTCSSSVLTCRSDHRLDGVHRSGPTPSPDGKGGNGTAVYSYRCTAKP